MKSKKIGLISLTLSVMMLFGACGSKKTSTATTTVAEKPYEATMVFLEFGSTPKDIQIVEDEINKISVPKVNVKVKLLPIGAGQYGQQLNLMLSGGEKLDIVSVFYDSFGGFVSKGQLLELDDLVAKYGKGVSSVIDKEYLKSGTVNGKLYAITGNGSFAGSNGIAMRKDLVDKYNIDISKIKTLDDFDGVLKTLKSKEPNLPLMISPLPGQGVLGTYQTWDNLGDNLGVLMNYGENLKVENLYETSEYSSLIKKMRSWYSAGYIAKDVATSKASATDLFKAGKAFAQSDPLGIYIDEENSVNYAQPMVSVNLTKVFTSTMSAQIHQWGIARNSEKPDKTMQLLDLMYTSKEINNLLSWGIEGKHYAKTSVDNVIDYPSGVDAKTTGYGLNMGWQFPNQNIANVWKGTPADKWSKAKTYSDSSVKSKAMGFVFDSSSVKTEVAGLTNVINQYKSPLESGIVDPDKMLPEFISKLKDAGIDKVIAEKQKQLDAWATTNNIK